MKRSAELLKRAQLRGFGYNAIANAYIARVAAGDQITLPEFLRTVIRGDLDHMLKDKSGQSLS
jgi:hypothetical protein